MPLLGGTWPGVRGKTNSWRLTVWVLCSSGPTESFLRAVFTGVFTDVTVTADSRDEVKTRGKTWVVFFQIRDQWISCASEFLAPNFSKVSSLYFFWSCFMCSGGFFFFFPSHNKIINKALRNKCQPSVEALFWKVRSHFDVWGYLMFDITKMKIWN